MTANVVSAVPLSETMPMVCSPTASVATYSAVRVTIVLPSLDAGFDNAAVDGDLAAFCRCSRKLCSVAADSCMLFIRQACNSQRARAICLAINKQLVGFQYPNTPLSIEGAAVRQNQVDFSVDGDAPIKAHSAVFYKPGKEWPLSLVQKCCNPDTAPLGILMVFPIPLCMPVLFQTSTRLTGKTRHSSLRCCNGLVCDECHPLPGGCKVPSEFAIFGWQAE